MSVNNLASRWYTSSSSFFINYCYVCFRLYVQTWVAMRRLWTLLKKARSWEVLTKPDLIVKNKNKNSNKGFCKLETPPNTSPLTLWSSGETLVLAYTFQDIFKNTLFRTDFETKHRHSQQENTHHTHVLLTRSKITDTVMMIFL